jgi:hypothetical protein
MYWIKKRQLEDPMSFYKIAGLLLIAATMPFGNAKAQKSQVRTVPGLHFDNNTEQYFINNKASFSIRPVEDKKYIDRIEFSIDGQGYSKYEGKISFDKEGFHIVRFKAVDPVLNWSPVESFRIYVDLSHPKTHVEWVGDTFTRDGTQFVGPKTKLLLTAYDNLSGVNNIFWRNGDGKASAYTSPLSFSNGDNFNLSISSRDHVGNEEPWNKIEFKLDKIAPISDANVKGNSFKKGNQLFLDKGSFISLDAKDDGSGIKRIEYVINNGGIKSYKDKIALEERKTSLKYRAVDNVGNEEEWKNVTVYLDADAPNLASSEDGVFRKIAGKYYARPGFKVSVNLSDPSSGPNSLVIDGKEPQIKTSEQFLFDKQGTFDLMVRGLDKVGNVSNTLFYNIVIDKEAPKTELSTSNPLVEKENIFVSSLPNRLMFSSNDNGVGVNYIEVSYNKQDTFKATAPIDLATWKNPKRTIYFRSVDQLGNKEPWQEKTIYVRNRGPKVDLFVESGQNPDVPLSELKKMYQKGYTPNRGLASEPEVIQEKKEINKKPSEKSKKYKKKSKSKRKSNRRKARRKKSRGKK